VNSEALQPYMDGRMDQKSALVLAQQPVRDFMIKQVVKAGNEEDVFLFTDFAKQPTPKTWGDVAPLHSCPRSCSAN